MGLAPSERASKIIRVDPRDHSFDELGPEISWVKGGPGLQSGGWGPGQSGAPCRPGGEYFEPLAPSEKASRIIIMHFRDHSFDELGPEISEVKGGPCPHSGR